MKNKKIPKILFVTRMALGGRIGPSMDHIDKLIKYYENRIIWFSISAQNDKTNQNYDIPYKSHPPIDKFVMIPLIKNFIRYVLGSRYLTLLISRFGKRHGADVVLADLSSDIISIGRMTAKKLRLPLVLLIHDDPISRLNNKVYPKIISKYLEEEFNKTMTFSKECAVISDYMGEYYDNQYNIRATTLYIGADEKRCAKPKNFLSNKKIITIGSLGSVHCFRNLDMVIEAISYLNKTYDGKYFSLKHIGDLPSKYLNLEDVHVTGWLDKEEVLKELKTIDIGLISVSFEISKKVTVMTSFPTKIHNYLEAQVPLLGIGPNYSAIVKFIKDFYCGQVCNNNSTEKISSKIIDIINNKDNYEKTKFGLLNAAKHFSRDNYFKNFEKIFTEI
jgi:glycosyltransferase involved in cell wall biosynthesis